MHYQVSISERAQNNLVKILLYLQTEWSLKIRNRFYDKFLKDVQLVSQNPYLFPIIDFDRDVRRCMITKHNALYFRLVNQEVEIITVHDVRQDPEKLKFDNGISEI
jgi:plasmid stabilization system protein ParE